jgi:protein O-GlcNAc transferase
VDYNIIDFNSFASSTVKQNLQLAQENDMRIPYSNCPLCESSAFTTLRISTCDWHKLWKPGLPAAIHWMRCDDCEHVFTDGVFTDEALRLIFSDTNPSQIPGHNVEANRGIWAPTVRKVATHVYPGRWLDVGFGDGGLLEVAQEFGYTAFGIDARQESVDLLNLRGVEASKQDFMELDSTQRFSVISLFDCLEHMPNPKQVLEHALSLLVEDGYVILSMPNMDTTLWRDLDRVNSNPYWGEIEHYHNFTRKRLIRLLEDVGFKFCCYDIPAGRYRVGMEVIAQRKAH